MAEYSKFASGSFVVQGGEGPGIAQVINLPFQPSGVWFQNKNTAQSPGTQEVFQGTWKVQMGQGVANTLVYSTSATALVADYVALNGISTFAAGQLLQFGVQQQVVSITKANPAVVTVTAHGYQTGDVVIFQGLYQTSTTGMPQICGIPFTITVVDANSFTIPWNTNQSNYTALSSSPSGAFVKKVLYPYLYEPGVSVISAISLGTTTQITTTDSNNYVVGQEVAFRIPAPWGTTQLNSLPNVQIPGSPLYGYVSAVIDAMNFVVTINSSSFTAFNTNQSVASVPGLKFPQVVAVGDVNTGGVQYSGGNLYPSPIVNGFPTINGPAIQGAFVNNTAQGFIIGAGVGTTATSAPLVGFAGNLIFWEAWYDDIVGP